MQKNFNIVYNMDCLIGMKEIPDKHFDLAVVDPPYGIGLDFLEMTDNGKSQLHDTSKKWNNKIPSNEYFFELIRVSRHQIIWGINYFPKMPNDKGGRIVWGKLPTSDRFSACDIASCTLQKKVSYFEYQWSGTCQNHSINWKNVENLSRGWEKRIHPTQKPIALYKWIFQNYVKKPDWKILDTHVGSGASRIAAYMMDLKFTGFELDPDFHQDQEKRFSDFKKQGILFL